MGQSKYTIDKINNEEGLVIKRRGESRKLLQLIKDKYICKGDQRNNRSTNKKAPLTVSHPKANSAKIACCHLLQNASVHPRIHSYDRLRSDDSTAFQAVSVSSITDKGLMHKILLCSRLLQKSDDYRHTRVKSFTSRSKWLKMCETENEELELPFPKLLTFTKSDGRYQELAKSISRS